MSIGNNTPDWNLYEAGKRYNNKLVPNYYYTVDANWEFYSGNQWRNLEATNMPKPVFNIIKRIIGFFVASITSSKTSLHFEPLLYTDDSDQQGLTPSDFANAEVENLFDKFKMDFKIKEALTNGAVTGDYAAHFYFDTNKQPYGNQYPDIKGEIEMELIDGANVMFGNANNPRIDVQPYVIIVGRAMVQDLKDEAQQYKDQQQNVDAIQMDRDYFYQSSDMGKIEVDGDESGKALYIIVYRKKKIKRKVKDAQGNEQEVEEMGITASKSVRNAYIYKDIDTGLKHYPVAWANWEKQKNQYHGRALATGMLPNQIFVNRMFAMVMYHLMMTAFPKAVYNADLIDVWNNEIGAAIPVSGMDLSALIRNIAGYLEPAQMSNQITEAINMVMQFTKETLGVNDAAMGTIENPQNTSAIIALQKASSIPLENPKAGMYEWIEDIGRILFDMMGSYYGKRPVVIEKDGQKQTVMYDFSEFKDMWLKVSANVGESSYWSEIAALQTLDNLLEQGRIEFIDYLERVPDEYIPKKAELISKLQEEAQNAKPSNDHPPSLSISFKDLPPDGQVQAAAMAGIQLNPNQMPNQMQASDPSQLISQLTPQEQQAFKNASPQQQQAVLAQLQQHLQQQPQQQQQQPQQQQQQPPQPQGGQPNA